ncbi:MAG: FmdE family protein [Dehalococcoidia bacterium]|nr:FmdE family protein [Dehalococcoidia bacterium]
MSSSSSLLVRQGCVLSAKQHQSLCPRQVLGVRMGVAGLEWFDLPPVPDKRILVFTETDGCFADGVIAATGCTVGHRTLRVIDYGRVALTMVDSTTAEAIRIAPHADVRTRSAQYAPEEPRGYEQQLLGYERMPADELLHITPVALTLDLPALIGRPGVRVNCARCGEEVLNGREITTEARAVCAGCAGAAYYCARAAAHTA